MQFSSAMLRIAASGMLLGQPVWLHAQDGRPEVSTASARAGGYSSATPEELTDKVPPAEYQQLLDSAALLPAEIGIHTRLQVADRLRPKDPDWSLRIARSAFEDATQAKYAHDWEAVDSGSPAAQSVEGHRPLSLLPGLSAMALQTRAIALVARVNLDEALRWVDFLPRMQAAPPDCGDYLLATSKDRLEMLRRLADLVWRFPPEEETSQLYRRRLFQIIRDELALVHGVNDLPAALWLVSGDVWSLQERRELTAIVASTMGRVPILTRPNLKIFQAIHMGVLAIPLTGDPGSPQLLRDAWAGLMERQLDAPVCEGAEDSMTGTWAWEKLRSLRNSNWEEATGRGVKFTYLSRTFSITNNLPAEHDEHALEGFRVAALWADDEGLRLAREISSLNDQRVPRVPMVTMPDGTEREFPLRREVATGQIGTREPTDLVAFSERFSRYRQEQDLHDLAAIYRLGFIWEQLLKAMRATPEFVRELAAYGRFLEETPLFREDPPAWLLRAHEWLGLHQMNQPSSVTLESFPRLHTLVRAEQFGPRTYGEPRVVVPRW